jgi:hypothetical protein
MSQNGIDEHGSDRHPSAHVVPLGFGLGCGCGGTCGTESTAVRHMSVLLAMTSIGASPSAISHSVSTSSVLFPVSQNQVPTVPAG